LGLLLAPLLLHGLILRSHARFFFSLLAIVFTLRLAGNVSLEGHFPFLEISQQFVGRRLMRAATTAIGLNGRNGPIEVIAIISKKQPNVDVGVRILRFQL
jgi:hypothetical protein